MEKKPESAAKSSSTFGFLFHRLSRKGTNSSSGGRGEARRWRINRSAGLRWKWRFNFHLFDDLIFKIMSVLEAVVLVSGLCFFFLCCGCRL